MTDKNKLRDTILDMEASLSTNLNGYSMWHYGADIHGITRETLENAIEAFLMNSLGHVVPCRWIGFAQMANQKNRTTNLPIKATRSMQIIQQCRRENDG